MKTTTEVTETYKVTFEFEDLHKASVFHSIFMEDKLVEYEGEKKEMKKQINNQLITEWTDKKWSTHSKH